MNDKGKTVKSIDKVSTSYCRIVRGKDKGRYIEVSMRLRLEGERTEPAGHEGTMRLIDAVGSRVIGAIADEFLP